MMKPKSMYDCKSREGKYLHAKLDSLHQVPKERIQHYYNGMEKLVHKGRIKSSVKQRCRFLVRLECEIDKLCVVKVYANMEELLATTIDVERVLGKIGETSISVVEQRQG